MTHKIKRTGTFVLIVLIIVLNTVPCSAINNSSTTVKVGYFDCGDYYKIENGKLDSYDVDYLDIVSAYSDLNFEYVDCGTWANAVEMLKNHEIDLLGTMQTSPEREKEFSICNTSYGITVAELVTLPDSGIEYEQHEKISASRLGVLNDYVRMRELNELLKDHSLCPQISYYNTQEELFAALKENKVDIIAANSHTVPTYWNVVEKFHYTSFNFATWKGNEGLTEKLDNAMLSISLYDTDLQSKLQKKYFPNMVKEAYTSEELEFISGEPTIDVYINDGSQPLTYRDENGEMIGILVDLCNMIQQETGLRFNYKALASKQNDDSKTSIVINVPDSSVSKQATISNTFFTTNFLLYYRVGSGMEINTNKAYKVVLPQNRQSFIDYLKVTYPNCIIEKMDTPEECIRAVSNGKADITMLSSYLVDNICTRRDITNLASIPSQGLAMNFSMILEGPNAEKLTGILNKGIAGMDDQEKNAILFTYALNTSPDNTFKHFVKTNSLIIALSIFFIFAAICAFIYAQMVSKKNKAINKANAAKSEFLSAMSHDIRTPMNAIINIAKLAQEDYADGSGDIMADLKQISTVSDFLLGLLNDVLDMSSIESQKYKLHPEVYDYEEFLNYISSIFEPLCKQKNINFICEKGSTNLKIYVDKVRFNQAFFNLLSNAVKYTPEGGTVTYRVTNNKVENGKLFCVFEVADTGCGMSTEFQKHMFDPFERETATRMAYQGTGLGLTIAKNIFVQMGGKITVKSKKGEGTAFFVTLSMPLATEEQIAAVKIADEPTNILMGKHILVVDDNETNIVVLTRFLAKKDIITTVAYDGKDAVEKFEKSDIGGFDMILMDVRMPIMDGLEATKTIRSLDRSDAKTVPILALTADAFDEDITDSIKSGMNAHLTKPIDATVLFQNIQQYMK